MKRLLNSKTLKMMNKAVCFENISKQYYLGEVGTGTISRDLERAWAKLRGKPDPFAKVGDVNDREKSGGEFVWALKDIDFDVQQGEVLGIIGRNGAGKSTLLKLLSRVTAPTSGEIKARGRIASLLEVGTGFHPELTGRENIYLNGAILGMRRHEITRRLDEIVEFSGCAKYIDTPVKRYSSGMMVRLGFSVAAHLECEILIVDEVLAVGDIEFQRKCLGRMRSIAAGGRTVLFVSHNLAALGAICQSSMVLTNGTISFFGGISEGVDYYLGKMSKRLTHVDYEPLSDCDLQLRSVSVSDKNGGSLGVFSLSDPIIIRIEYDVPLPLEHVQIVVHVWNIHRVHVLATADIDDEPQLLDRRDPGRYVAEVTLPQSLLAPGVYQVSVACGVPNLRLIDDREGPTFEITAIQSHAAQWSGARHDVIVAMPMNWKTSREGAA